MFLDADNRHSQCVRAAYTEEEIDNLTQDQIDSVKVDRSEYINTCILLPTRELAVQVQQVVKNIISQVADIDKYRFRTCLIAGGFAVEKQERELTKTPEILIATVGRLWDLIQSGQHESLLTLCRSHFLIFDEIDRILELGQYKELEMVLKFFEDP